MLEPSTPESVRCQLVVSDRVLDASVAKVVLDGPGIDALIGEVEPKGVLKHLRVGRQLQNRLGRIPLDLVMHRRPRWGLQRNVANREGAVAGM